MYGRLVWDAEKALLSSARQGEKEGYGNPVHLLRDPHRKSGTSGRAVKRTRTGDSGLAAARHTKKTGLQRGDSR